MVDEAMKKQNEEFMGSDLSLPHCFSRILPSWLEICMIDMCLEDGEGVKIQIDYAYMDKAPIGPLFWKLTMH